MFPTSYLLRHIAAVAAQRSAGNGKIAELLQQALRDQHATGRLSLCGFQTSCNSQLSDEEKPGDTENPEEGTSLPEFATAAEMRQWADRMLERKAASTEDGDLDTVSLKVDEDLDTAAKSSQHGSDAHQPDLLPELQSAGADSDAAMSQAPKEDGAVVDNQSLAVEEEAAAEAAAVVEVPVTRADVSTKSSKSAPKLTADEDPTDAWIRFVEAHFGQRISLPTGRARSTAKQSEGGPVAESDNGAVPAWQKYLKGEDASEESKPDTEKAENQVANDQQNFKLPDFFSMTDPRRELERLLPESARRHGLTQSGFIQAQESKRAPSASEPVPFKATAPFLEPSGPPGEPPPRRVTVLEAPMDRLANPVTGYAHLGRPRSERLGARSEDWSMGELGRKGNFQDAPRLHPTRIFYPGQTYDPEDLVESGEQIGWRKHALKVKTEKARNGEVRAKADFRNQAFLNRFISELGKLPPKRTTRLQQKTHRHLCRQIKLARQMALLPIDSQLPSEYLDRTGAVQKQALPGIEHNPHLRQPLLDRRAGLPGSRGARERPRKFESGEAAAPQPSRWSNMVQQFP